MSRAAIVRLARASARASAPSAPSPIASHHRPTSSVVSLGRSGGTHFASPSSSPSSQQQQQQRRSLSSNNVTPAAADRRIAGRKRFYKLVEIRPCPPPEGSAEERTITDGSGDSSNTVDSPISAGVDGTQSATGVSTSVPDPSLWSSLLNSSSSSWHTITLDGRAPRTPLGLPLALPSLDLALAVASEWDSQTSTLRPAQMPLMTLCCTAIDQAASDPSGHRDDVMRYLRNDTSCYWADPVEDRMLHRKQRAAWDGLHSSVSEEALGLPEDVRPATAEGGGEALLISRASGGNRSSGLPHPPVLVERARKWVEGLDAWTLTALYSACAESKSFFVGAALIRDAMTAEDDEDDARDGGGGGGGGRIARDGRWAAGAARVEEEFNIECWGLVEGGHDYDRLNCSIQMHAASFLARTVARQQHCEE